MPFPYRLPYKFETEPEKPKLKPKAPFGRLVFVKRFKLKVPLLVSVYKKIVSKKFIKSSVLQRIKVAILSRVSIKRFIKVKSEILSGIVNKIVRKSEVISKVKSIQLQKSVVKGEKSYKKIKWLLEDED